MATIPSTLIVKLLDPANFNLAEAEVVMKEMFSFGVKKITAKGNRIYISLTYTPKHANLKYKFGNLPIQYLRTKMENPDKDLKLFERVLKKYQFNLRGEEEEDATIEKPQQSITTGSIKRNLPPIITEEAGPSKKKLQPMTLISDTEDDEEEVPAPILLRQYDEIESQLY